MSIYRRDMNILTIFQGLAIHSVAVVQIMIISEATVSVEDVIKEINALENIISVELQKYRIMKQNFKLFNRK